MIFRHLSDKLIHLEVALCRGSGDLAAQRIEARQVRFMSMTSLLASLFCQSQEIIKASAQQEIDLRRLISTAIYGGVFLAPAGK